MNLLKFMRVDKELSQKDLMQKTGVPAPYICNIETGKFNPSSNQLQRLADGLGFRGNPRDLLSEAVIIGLDMKFDTVSFGEKLRLERRKAGYRNTRDFSAAIKALTGIYVDSASLMRYERNEREPTLTKLMAMVVTLYGSLFDDGLIDLCRTKMRELSLHESEC